MWRAVRRDARKHLARAGIGVDRRDVQIAVDVPSADPEQQPNPHDTPNGFGGSESLRERNERRAPDPRECGDGEVEPE